MPTALSVLQTLRALGIVGQAFPVASDSLTDPVEHAVALEPEVYFARFPRFSDDSMFVFLDAVKIGCQV